MRKVCFWGVVTLALVFGVVVNSTQAAYTPAQGDIIKTATDSAVYYIGSDGKRHLYVNEVTFWTWYDGDWSNIMENGVQKTVQTISQAEFESIELGDNTTVKPGRKLIKFQNSPSVYNVTDHGKLAKVTAEQAINLFGQNWNDQVITIQNGFEVNYTKDGELDTVNKFEALKQLFADKYDKETSEITLSVSNEIATHVKGGVSMGEGPGSGGYFLATNINGAWELVFDGNGAYECSMLYEYEFPATMTEGCY